MSTVSMAFLVLPPQLWLMTLTMLAILLVSYKPLTTLVNFSNPLALSYVLTSVNIFGLIPRQCPLSSYPSSPLVASPCS